MASAASISDPALLRVLDAAALVRQQSLAILDMLDAQHTAAAADPTQSPPSDERARHQQLALSREHKQLYAYLARLRGLNRKAILSVRATKQDTAEARQEVDALHLQLQNLDYEQRHLRGEIAACEHYEYGCLRPTHMLVTPT